jgi:hypothetical protein
MRVLSPRVSLLLLAIAPSALAQAPTQAAPAPEPAPVAQPQPEPPPPAPVPPPPAPAPTPPPEPAPAAEETPAPATESQPAPAAERVPTLGAVTAPAPQPQEPVPTIAAPGPKPKPERPWQRANTALTLEGRLGFSIRTDSDVGFQHESAIGSELGLSLYLDLGRQLALGLELERIDLGRGNALHELDSVSVDYTATSAMLGLRAYPYRGELLDLFIGLQVGAGIQNVAASGTTSNGLVKPASSYICSASDSPSLELGGGIGARLMLTPRLGVTARVDGIARRLSGDTIDGCGQGIGGVTSVASSLGLGYDFDLSP